MCGIIGYVGRELCIPKIIHGLQSLEYRGMIQQVSRI